MNEQKIRPRSLKKCALFSALLLELSGQVSAATINVDGTTCSLPDAVTAANNDTVTGGCVAGSGADVLELDIAGSPFVLSSRLEISTDVTINGNESTISGGNTTSVVAVGLGGMATLNDVTITEGFTPVNNLGAGVVVGVGSGLNINRSTLTNNNGGAVRFVPGSMGTINDSIINSNDGIPASGLYSGGVSIAGATVTISNSTISNNTTDSVFSGGGLYIGNFGGDTDVTIVNTTVSGNSSTARGGGISHYSYGNQSNISLTNVTLVNNTSEANGGGLSNDLANITISQSIVSGNNSYDGTQINSTGGTVTVDNFNVFGASGNAGLSGVTVGGTDIVPTVALADILDPMLANNGGSTDTHALVENSPAIDAIPAALCALNEDQTGAERPMDGDADGIADCDVGAYENRDKDIIFKNGFE